MSEHIYGGVAIEHGAAKGETRLERREEIVRCRDCKWFIWDDSGRWCAQSLVRHSDPDGFCAWAERKVDE